MQMRCMGQGCTCTLERCISVINVVCMCIVVIVSLALQAEVSVCAHTSSRYHRQFAWGQCSHWVC